MLCIVGFYVFQTRVLLHYKFNTNCVETNLEYTQDLYSNKN